MMKKTGGFRILLMVAFLGAALLCAGCAKLGKGPSADPGASVKNQKKGPVPSYALDFGDVLIPAELKVIKKDSFVYRTSDSAAGVLVYKGRVTAASLLSFFENNMPGDGWSMVCEFKSVRSVLLFQKENRWCVINITDRTGGVNVEVWVAPTLKKALAGEVTSSDGLFK